MDIHAIARANGIKLIEIVDDKNLDRYYINRSSCIGTLDEDPEIILGVYNDEECRTLSFLHELAHILYKYPQWSDEGILTKYEWELQVWNNTYRLANEYKFYISPNSIKWAHDQLASYIGWEEREVMNYKRY